MLLRRLRRWRTWIFNAIMALLISPDLYLALVGYDWSMIIPPRFMPYVTLLIIGVNVAMRPRPASDRKHEPVREPVEHGE